MATSCQGGGPGLNNCGTGNESCCASEEVVGGTYYRTYANGGDGGMGEADPATVSGFRLDKYDVTVGRFRQFVNAVLPPDGGGGWLPPAASGKHTHLNAGSGLANGASPGTYETGWVASDNGYISPTTGNLECGDPGIGDTSTWTASAGSQENLPISCVNWYEAYAFCIWDGGFLPSEAEWEYAAAGGSEQREFPWGSTTPGAANQYAIYGDGNGRCYYPTGTLATCTGVANIAPVGTATLGAGLWGQLDLAGELWEWNLDWYAPYIDPCADCANLTGGSSRVIRSGYYLVGASQLLAPYRNDYTPTNGLDFGFRCARTP